MHAAIPSYTEGDISKQIKVAADDIKDLSGIHAALPEEHVEPVKSVSQAHRRSSV